MDKYHSTSPQRFQAIRLFTLIEQLNSLTTSIINAQAIDKFLKSVLLPCRQDLVKFMHSIDKEDKQMNKEYWGLCISRVLKNVKVNCQVDYMNLHNRIKEVLTGNYVQPLYSYELWDGSIMKNQFQKDQIYARIIDTCGGLSLFIKKIDFMVFEANIQSINTCFSLINLMPYKVQQIYQIFENILNGTFLQVLQYGLSNQARQVTLIQMLKSLCYLYQSAKYQNIRKLLQNSFLWDNDIIKGLTQNIYDKRPQVRYYTCAMLALIVNNVKKAPAMIFTDKDLLQSISNAIGNIAQNEGLMFGLKFMIGIIRQFENLSEEQKKQNMKVISVYLNFAVNKLFQISSEITQSACIQLVSECVRIIDFADEDLKLLKFVNNVFEGAHDKKFQALFQTTLDIIKNSILFNRIKVREYLISDKNFQNYIKKLLSAAHQQWQPYYSALQIILLIARSGNVDFLIQRDLIPAIFALADSPNGLVRFYLSQILLYIIINTLQSDWKITYVYEKQILRVIGTLFGSFYQPDQMLANQYQSQSSLSYCNRDTFITALKCLYYLNFHSGLDATKKKQLYVKNFSNYFIDQFSKGLKSYFSTTINSKYLVGLLKQEQNLSQSQLQKRGNPTKTLKLMSGVIEQMTLCLRKKYNSIQTLKEVNRTRNDFHKLLYQFFTYNQLVGQNIPIYLIYVADVLGHIMKQRVYKLSYNQFRSLMWQFIKKSKSIEAASFIILSKQTSSPIRNQNQYRNIIDKALQDFNSSNFVVEFIIVDIRDRNQVRDMTSTTHMRLQNQQYNRNMQVPRFMSYRMPQARDLSPINSRYGVNSMRNTSPNFGSPCRQCNRITSNRTQICNNCVQARTYR